MAKGPRIVATLNQKGGVGKTMLTVNLAAAAHLTGRRVLLLDLDTQGSAFEWFGERGETSKLAGLAVAQAPKALSLQKLEALAWGYDVVLLDGPARLEDITRAAAVAADVVVIPLEAGCFDWWATRGTRSLLEEADDVRAVMGRGPVRRVFALNAVPAQRSNLKRDAIEAITSLEGRAPVVISNRDAFKLAAHRGESVLTLEPSSAAAAEIQMLYLAVFGGVDVE